MKRIALTFALSAGMVATSGTADAGLFDCFKKKDECKPVCCAPAAPVVTECAAPVVSECAPVVYSEPVVAAPASDCGCEGTVTEGTVIESHSTTMPTMATDGLPPGATIISTRVIDGSESADEGEMAEGDYSPKKVEDVKAPKPPEEKPAAMKAEKKKAAQAEKKQAQMKKKQAANNAAAAPKKKAAAQSPAAGADVPSQQADLDNSSNGAAGAAAKEAAPEL